MAFDATPFQGEFFANVLHHSQVDADKKRAVDVHTLVRGSSIEG